MSQLTLKAGEKVFEEGDQSKSAYFIKKGIIRIYKKKGDTSVEIDTIRAGQLLGELAFLDNNPRSASAEAIVESEIIEISQKVLDETLSKTPDWLKVLLKTIASRLRNASNKIRELENASTTYETDKWGNRSKEFVFCNRSELLRFCSGLIAISARYGEQDTLDGVRFSSNILERFTQQVLQLNESKVASLMEMFKAVNLLKIAPEDGGKPMLYLTDADFLDKFVWFVNDQSLQEASKQRALSPRGFLMLGLMMKNIHLADELKDGSSVLNVAPVLNTDGRALVNPPLRSDELQELMDQKFVSGIKVDSVDDIGVTFLRDKLTLEFRIFRILSELDKLNEKKRKIK